VLYCTCFGPCLQDLEKGVSAISVSQKRCCSALQQLPSSLKVRVVDFLAPCFFFRKRGAEFALDELPLEGLCPDLFFHIYPQYLSLLYDGRPLNHARDSNESVIRCPGTGGKTIWRVRSAQLWLGPFINLTEKLFRLIGMPRDLFNKKIVMELLKTEGTCPRGYSGNLVFTFNQYSHIWKRRCFCPALFYTVYPFLTTLGVKATHDKSTLRIQCPSDDNTIQIEIDLP